MGEAEEEAGEDGGLGALIQMWSPSWTGASMVPLAELVISCQKLQNEGEIGLILDSLSGT